MKRSHNALAIGATIAAIGAGAPAASAESAKTHKLDARAQAIATKLGKRIAHAHVKGEVPRAYKIASGPGSVTNELLVSAANMQDNQPGEYLVSVISPVKPSGKPDLSKAQQIAITEGPGDAEQGIVHPYSSQVLIKNVETGGWTYFGEFQSFKGSYDDVNLNGASTHPKQHEAKLSMARLHSVELAMNEVLDAMESLQPVGPIDMAFGQPPHTTVTEPK